MIKKEEPYSLLDWKKKKLLEQENVPSQPFATCGHAQGF